MIMTASAFLLIALILAAVSFAIRKNPPEESVVRVEDSLLVSDAISVLAESIEEQSVAESIEEQSIVESVIDASQVFNESIDVSVEASDTETSHAQTLNHGWVINDFGYTYVYNGCGYEQFNYKNTALDRYANSLTKLSSVVPEHTRLFSMTVPVSSTFVNIPREIYTSDNFFNQSQSAFVSTVASKISNRIVNVPIVAQLEAKYDSGEYVFFRTDKNWTSLGAYTAYSAYCEKAGITPYSIENFTKREVGEYLGSFYNATKNSEMSDNPDSFVCYSTIPSVKTSLTIYDSDIVYADYVLCNNNVDYYNAYNIYLGRNAARYEISSTAEGGSLLIIGDSSSYPIVPLLASHYSKVDVIDPRMFKGSLSDFFIDHKYDDCIMMCYSTNAVSGEYIPKLNIITGENTNE